MDSTAEDVRDGKRARLAPSADADLISALGDDVLVRVLGLAADARDAVRTGALSRRWRGLWTRVPALRFAYRPAIEADSLAAAGAERCAAALERYVSSVNHVLARRAHSADHAVESLAISFTPACSPGLVGERLVPAWTRAAQGWIRYAVQHGVKLVAVELGGPPDPSSGVMTIHDFDDKRPVVALDELPASPARLETMRLALGGAKVRLPATVVFASLTEISLERIKITAAGGAHLLGRLVSSASCPILRKLVLRTVRFARTEEKLLLETGSLSELWLEGVVPVRSLELRAHSLRVFHIQSCFHEAVMISAPRLEELKFFQGLYPSRLEVDGGLSCVRSLKLHLWSHEAPIYATENDIGILLLKHCSSVRCLDVALEGGLDMCEGDVNMINGRIRRLPHVTSLSIQVSPCFGRHDFGASIATFLTPFTNLRHLSLHLPSFDNLLYDLRFRLNLLCDHPNNWTSHEIFFIYLEEVELTGLTGIDCELWLMEAVMSSATRLRKVAISFNPDCLQDQGKMDAFERLLTSGGMWTYHRDIPRLTCLKQSPT
ncbi:hypothetical protein ACP70R_043991 [Stipagrostis hirtigluma subsp. patula]